MGEISFSISAVWNEHNCTCGLLLLSISSKWVTAVSELVLDCFRDNNQMQYLCGGIC